MKYVQCSCRKEWQLMETLTGRCRFCRKTSATHRKSVPADSWWSEQAREAEVPREIVAWLQGVEMKWQSDLTTHRQYFEEPDKVIKGTKNLNLSPLAHVIAEINWPDIHYCGYLSNAKTPDQLWKINPMQADAGAGAGYLHEGLREFPATTNYGLFYDRVNRRMVQAERSALQISPWPAQPKK